jgi:hypothetical protein
VSCPEGRQAVGETGRWFLCTTNNGIICGAAVEQGALAAGAAAGVQQPEVLSEISRNLWRDIVDNTRRRREPQRSVFGNKQTFAGSHSVVCLQPQNYCGRRGERL